jgi:hypothetical protein
MKSLEICETLNGHGKVYRRAGDFLGDVDFSLEVWRNYYQVDGKTKQNFDYVTGVISGLDNVFLMADLLTLHLDEERRLDFFIYDFSGRIVADGGLYDASAGKTVSFS